MPDVGAQSMLGGFAVARKLALPNGTGACFDWAVSDPILPGMGEDSPEGLYNAVFIVMQVHPFHPTLMLLLPACAPGCSPTLQCPQHACWLCRRRRVRLPAG
jgi:hypothetical protein